MCWIACVTLTKCDKIVFRSKKEWWHGMYNCRWYFTTSIFNSRHWIAMLSCHCGFTALFFWFYSHKICNLHVCMWTQSSLEWSQRGISPVLNGFDFSFLYSLAQLPRRPGSCRDWAGHDKRAAWQNRPGWEYLIASDLTWLDRWAMAMRCCCPFMLMIFLNLLILCNSNIVLISSYFLCLSSQTSRVKSLHHQ